MADRTVQVTLKASIGDYLAKMRAASAASGNVATTAGRDFQRLGASMQSAGRAATLGITVPLIAVGGASVHAAMQFETAFAQMVGLANVPAGEVDALKESVLALAGETATAPQQLADGLYFAASAGLDAAAAMDVVEMAARASAAGMGSTADVVNLVSGAIAAYGADNITAAKATDILTATIREGKAEPDELAAALGRVTPIAAQMGIGFDEVGGAAAFMSNIIGDTDETVTALRGALLAMMDPTEQGRKTLEEMGTSFEELQAAIAQDGLLGALELLREHGFQGNSEAMSNLFEDNRALVGATILLNDETGRLTPTMEAVADSTGAAGDAFSAVADTDAFKMKQALVDVQTAMVQLGAILLPVVADIADGIAGLVGWFSGLPDPVQKVALALGATTAAAGPLLIVAGSLVRNWSLLSKAFKGSAGPMSAASKALGAIGIAATVGFLAFQAFTEDQRETDAVTRSTAAALDVEIASLFGVAGAARIAGQDIDGVAVAQEALNNALVEGNEELADELSNLNVSAEQTLDVLALFDDAPVTAIDFLARSFGLTAEQADLFANSVHGIGSGFPTIERGAIEAAEAMGLTEEQFMATLHAIQQFAFAADDSNLQDIALAFLNGRVQAEGYEGSLVAAAEANLGFTRQTGDALAVYREWALLVGEADAATMAAASGADELATATTGVGVAATGATAGVAALEEEMVSASDAMESLQEIFDGMRAPNWPDMFPDASSDFRGFMADAQFFGEAIHGTVDPMLALMQAEDQLRSSTNGLSDAIDDNSSSLVGESDAAIANREVIFGLIGDILGVTDAQIGMGYTTDTVTRTIGHNRDALLDNAEAAGFNRDEVAHLIDTLGLMPEDVATTVTLAGELYFLDKINEMLDDIGEIPESVETEMEAILMTDGAQAAADHLEAYIERDTTIGVFLELKNFRAVSNQISSLSRRGFGSAEGRFVRGGTNMVSSLGELSGSRGDEVVLPLGDPGRMAALLGMSEVGPRVWAALTPMMGGFGGGQPSAGGGTNWHIENVNVSDPRQLPQVSHELERAVFLVGAGAR